VNRRVLLLGAAGSLTGCGTAQPGPTLWHNGQITVGTGPTSGVFSQIGAGYADVITRHMPPYEAVAVPTSGAGENLTRLTRGDCDVAFTFADVAADAPPTIRALARVFNSYTHLVVRASSGVTELADLAGLRVGTGPARSGTENVANRILAAANLTVKRVTASLNQMTAAMRAQTLDAMFYSAGLPTVGITALFTQQPGVYTLLPVGAMLSPLVKAYPGVYVEASIPRAIYGSDADVPTVAIPTLIVVNASLPEQLAYDFTRVIFEFQPELAAVHPEGRNISLAAGSKTSPVPLHPGAQRYYDDRP